MKFSKGKHVLSGTLAAGLLLSTAFSIHPLAEKPEVTITHKNVEDFLSNLSKEQRQAIQKLNAGPNFTISPEIKTNSPELVSVIVEFEQAPAQVAVKKQAVLGKKMAITSAKNLVDQSHQDFKSYIESLKKKKDFIQV